MMNNIKSLLVVDDSADDQSLISLLFKRSLSNLHFSSLAITFASTLTEAREHLSKTKFDIITLDGMIPEIIHGGPGYLLISDIQETQSPECIIIMICGEKSAADKGKSLGAHFSFTKEILTNTIGFTPKNFDLQRFFSEGSLFEPISVY